MKTKYCALCGVSPTKFNRLAYTICYPIKGSGYEPAMICGTCRDAYHVVGKQGITCDIEPIRKTHEKIRQSAAVQISKIAEQPNPTMNTQKTDKAAARPAMEIARDIWPGSASLSDTGNVEHTRDLECLAQTIEEKMKWNEYDALCKIRDAYEKLRAFYFDDLAKNNKGFIGKLCVQDFGAMNEAYIACEIADAAIRNQK